MKTILFKPIDRFQESHVFIAGMVTLVLGTLIASFFNARFDGILDLHFGNPVSLSTVFFDNIINVFSLFIPLFILGKVINVHTRIIDILNTVLISRIPYFILPFFNIKGLVTKSSEELLRLVERSMALDQISGFTYFIMTFFAVLSMAAMVWSIVLLFNGFKISVNLKNKMHIIWFGVSILCAEILSKLIISKFN